MLESKYEVKNIEDIEEGNTMIWGMLTLQKTEFTDKFGFNWNCIETNVSPKPGKPHFFSNGTLMIVLKN